MYLLSAVSGATYGQKPYREFKSAGAWLLEIPIKLILSRIYTPVFSHVRFVNKAVQAKHSCTIPLLHSMALDQESN